MQSSQYHLCKKKKKSCQAQGPPLSCRCLEAGTASWGRDENLGTTTGRKGVGPVHSRRHSTFPFLSLGP